MVAPAPKLRELAGPAQAALIWDEGARLNVYEAAAIALADPAREPQPRKPRLRAF